MTDGHYYLLLIVSLGITALAQFLVKSRYAKYKQVTNQSGVSGEQIARKILNQNGMQDVPVVPIDGELTDNYNPTKKTVYLSKDIYDGTTIAGIAVAAHECGHAIQHHTGYTFMRVRSGLVPVLNISSKISYILIAAGAIFGAMRLFEVGVILESVAVLFQLVTLPVEFDASRRGLQHLKEFGVFDGNEMVGCKKMLTAAALTYVGAALSALASLFRLVLMLQNSKGQRERR